MHVVVVTPPAPFVTLAQAKAQLGVNHNEDNDRITLYVAAAIAHLDGPEGYLRRAIGSQVLAATVYGLPCGRGARGGLALPYPPVTTVNDVEYVNAAGATVHIPPDAYELTPDGRLQLAWGASWPSVRSCEDPITITYSAGYPVVPKPIVAAVLMHVTAMYDSGDEGAGFPEPARDLVEGNYRIPRF